MIGITGRRFEGLKVGDTVIVYGNVGRFPVEAVVTKIGRKWFSTRFCGDFSLENGANRSGYSGSAQTVDAHKAWVRAGHVRGWLLRHGYELGYFVKADKVTEVYEGLRSIGKIGELP
jgi:hypothetical protein